MIEPLQKDVHTWAVWVTYNRVRVGLEALSDRIEGLGFDVEQAEPIGRAGKQIVIPRNVAT